MSIRSRCLIGTCQLLITLPLAAQESTVVGERTARATDSTWAAGWREGKASAEEPVVVHRALIGFVAGLPSSLLAVGVLGEDPRAILGLGASVGTIAAAGAGGNSNPSAGNAEYASSHGPEFERGFRTGYAERLHSRRVRAAVTGGAVGAATGLSFLLWVVAHLD